MITHNHEKRYLSCTLYTIFVEAAAVADVLLINHHFCTEIVSLNMTD